ncbi:Hypothetical predicted protein [Marmota monax]|uniref:Serpin domain-containing protein n=1 Tax=Marmota monax TaxID=9995 RepID=A0A5E4D316_MARMO|nr:Hypothetical predicted protein [Marmota monax]
MSSLSAANTKFTLDLFRQLRKDGDNVFYSPVSILSALAMLDLGARGDTALQMEKVLHFNEITEKATKKATAPHAGESGNVHHEIQKFLTELNKPSDAYNLKIANRVYGEKEFQFLQEYLDGIKKFYLATVESLDFKNAPEESRKKINSWVESQTNEKIKDLFPSGSIDQTTRLVLVNAVYFKGRWDKEFKKELTTEAKFWQNKNVSKSVQMMAKSGHFNFAFLEGVQAKILEIPYKGNDLSMVLLLPNEADGLQEMRRLHLVAVHKSLKQWQLNIRTSHEIVHSILSKNHLYLHDDLFFFPLTEKIKDLFPSGSIDQTTRLVLVNAVYFKGRWDKEFKKELTTEAKFWQNKNVSKSVQMMAKSGHFNFAFLEGVQAKILEIPYKGNDLSMVLLLPNEADGLQELEDKLTAEKLMEWTSPESMEMTNVNVCLPRFKVEETYDLVTILRAMGMEDVFCPKKADLSGMTGTQGLSVSKVVHKSFVEVNEEGTEAAAATGIVVEVTSAPMPPVSFYCDHPFLFFIKQKKTDSILFFGRVSSP